MLDGFKIAAIKIENCWCRFRDQQMFQLIKYAICSADHSLTHEIIRNINPIEAELLNDPVFKAKIKFRFAGDEFPPYIVFKIFIETNGLGLKYLSGKKTIQPASEAAVDSCNLMGNRKFLDQMLSDLCEGKQNQVNDVLDISNLQDYMKYLSKRDEASAKAGGKENSWRKLSLQVVPRQHIIYDVLTYLQKGQRTDKLSQHLHAGLIVPPSQTKQVEYINMLSTIKSSEPTRRSRQTRDRVSKMKKAYLHQPTPMRNETGAGEYQSINDSVDIYTDGDGMTDRLERKSSMKLTEIDFDDESWDNEGQLLFEWTKNLSYDNLTLH